MLRRLLILDAALVALLVMGGMKLHKDWKAFGPTHDVASIKARPHAYPPIPVGGTTDSIANAEWTDIPSKDPFSFDRNDIDIVPPAVVEAPPPKPLGPKPILFGTFILGNDRTAFLASGPTGNRNSRPMKLGETIDGWTIVDIGSKSVQVESNGTRQAVIINDPTAQVPRDVARNAGVPAPAVVQTITPPAPAPSTNPPSSPTSSVPSAAPAAASPLPPAPAGTTYVRTPFGPMTVTESKDSPSK